MEDELVPIVQGEGKEKQALGVERWKWGGKTRGEKRMRQFGGVKIVGGLSGI